MARHAGQVLTNRTILKTIRWPHVVDQPEHVPMLIRQLRTKNDPDPTPTPVSHQRALGGLPLRGWRRLIHVPQKSGRIRDEWRRRAYDTLGDSSPSSQESYDSIARVAAHPRGPCRGGPSAPWAGAY
jgi:hypothetical protein